MTNTTGRIHTPRSWTAPVFSGALDEMIARHVRERFRHFFFSVFAMKALCDLLRRNHDAVLNPAQGFSGKATHQIDSGDRSDKDEHMVFDKTASGMGGEVGTAFRKMDAAHFCNLGLKTGFEARFRTAARTDETVRDLLAFLEVMLGDTMQLPQKVNITADRRIDAVHAQLAGRVLAGPPVTDANMRDYLRTARVSLEAYVIEKRKSGATAYAEICEPYLAFYRDGKETEAVWQALRSSIRAEITARAGLSESDYIV